jgi:hypothetical protein
MGWGWFFVNIAMPVLIPPFGVLCLWCSTFAASAKASEANFKVMALFKDGQLAWIAAGMCAAALYEFVDTIIVYNEHQKLIPLRWFGLLFPLMTSIIGAMLVAASGAAYGTAMLTTSANIWGWISHYRTFASSVLVTVASAAISTTIHFGILPDISGYNFPGAP